MPAFLFGENMSGKSVKLRPQSSREEIANYINRAFETSNIVEICKAIGAASAQHLRRCKKIWT